jgi:hypothetical protein
MFNAGDAFYTTERATFERINFTMYQLADKVKLFQAEERCSRLFLQRPALPEAENLSNTKTV